jgi:hypothetical protein
MIRLYHAFTAQFEAEPEDMWVFDPAEYNDPHPALPLTHVGAWPADEKCGITTFQTFGMSQKKMKGADYFAELHMAIRDSLPAEQRELVARYLANLVAYPFVNERKMDWWEIITNAGTIPYFSACSHLLLHPRIAPEGFDELDDAEGRIKLIYIVPITPSERKLLVQGGKSAFEDYVNGERIDLLRDRD